MDIAAPVGILGFGIEGKSTLRYLVRKGIREIVVMDKNPVELPELPADVHVKIFSGEKYMDGLKNAVTVVRSAGVYPLQKEIFHFQMNGGALTSQIEIFLKETKSRSVVGVTGTLGKGSTVSMIRHALNACGIPSEIGGNFGVPALDLLENETPDRISILELSSFQLMTLPVSPHVAVVLRVSTEHLDWHKSVEEYRDAKANLVRWQKRGDFCVYIRDAEPSAAIARESGAQKLCYGSRDADAVFSSDSLKIDGCTLKLADCKKIGSFQLENMAAALLAVKALGADVPTALQSLKNYESLKFRMEFKGEKKGIVFYNDSYATRPDATMAAVKSMNRPFALILGGSEKNADFSELARTLAGIQNLKRIALIGATAERMQDALRQVETSVPMKIFSGLDEAFADACSVGNGGAVLLSPACASFGLFKNYKARGEAFDKLVDAF
ncbi:UDP-N-acetylmuramoyl-L-alanine--D-glutamate ligase [Fibrobacter intestinalis]|uniref:UDP-N-acetylmuramoylalanine--D-glutamate ligase n=1 Tax=Fibrobacter intestinalis TaxID=28122 RepID=A0A1T4LP99_9BACT|nr:MULTISPECIES: UDP-N-acetylmuramoyl-L-alanine--D-glutamate ligase [Fibrobacter]PBC73884.1 UDP-N-acetylmuramoylalanine--D-glutamate ligase [Fibrobacter sp. NR9]SJZ56481.1 UDP-N-acetylmuramoylalanine--D-glutamate ligase [Fibrobacter intestinalis]